LARGICHLFCIVSNVRYTVNGNLRGNHVAWRGIVGQLTEGTIVYDAATTSGGSGGPVINLDGEVVAVNSAIIPGFTGSNLGVPASEAARLLDAAR